MAKSLFDHIKAVTQFQDPNYWLNEEYDYAVKQGLVKDVLYKMVGYGK